MKLIPGIFLLTFILSCGQPHSQKEVNDKVQETSLDWKTLHEDNYSIQYPATWELDQSKQFNTTFILYSPIDTGKANFRSNINLIIQDLTGKNIDLNKYTEISEGQIKTMVTNPIIEESKRISGGPVEYQKIIYSGDQGIYHLKYEQHYLIVNEKAYILTLTTEQNKFADAKAIGEKILNGFEIKK
jgi:hypothetical protein